MDLEKVFDRIPREVVRWALRKLEVEEWLVKAVMIMYKKARTMVKTKHGNSEEFEVKVGVHQGLVLMEVLMQDVRECLPWELLYADDLVLMAESIEELKWKVLRWKECMEAKGLKMNIGKTKVMVSGKNCGDVERLGEVAMYCMWKGCWDEFYQMYGMQWMGTQAMLRCEGLSS